MHVPYKSSYCCPPNECEQFAVLNDMFLNSKTSNIDKEIAMCIMFKVFELEIHENWTMKRNRRPKIKKMKGARKKKLKYTQYQQVKGSILSIWIHSTDVKLCATRLHNKMFANSNSTNMKI